MPEALRGPAPVLLALALGTAAYALLYASPYGLRVLTVAGVYALAAIGFHIVFGLGGALSLAQGAFFGLGAYATGILATRWGLPVAITFPLSVLLPVLAALPVGLAVLRLESHYFALATLGVAQVLLLLAVNLPDLTGGSNGLAGVPGLELAGRTATRGLPLAAAVWGVAALGAVAAGALGRGRFGRTLRTVRDDPLGAGSLGIDVGRARLLAFAVAAAYGGAAGALAAHTQRVVSPEVLEFPVMVTVLTAVILGGRDRVAGAVLGAVLLLHLPEWLRFLERSYLLVYGVGLLAAVVAMPYGLTGLLERLFPPPPRRLPAPRPLPPPASRSPASRSPASISPAPVPAARTPAPPLLDVRGLAKAYGGVRAVDGVSFRLEPGRIVGLIGPNGSGKTTLMNLLSGLARPDAGAVLLAGLPATGERADRLAARGVARTFQAAALPDGATVLEAVAAARLTLDRSVAEAEAHAAGVLVRLDLADSAGRLCGDLPVALRRRADLARALARQPALLLLDEPAAGLADDETARLAAALREAAAGGTAVLVVEHDLGFLLPLADRILALDRGRLLYDGAADGVAHDPALVAAYLGGGGR